jgi:hypothetical protein
VLLAQRQSVFLTLLQESVTFTLILTFIYH